MKTHTGVIHGKIIELSENPGLPDGVEVEIQVTTRQTSHRGEGLRRCAGALAGEWSILDDEILAEIEHDRLDAVHRELPQ